jgi:hypothetical protein
VEDFIDLIETGEITEDEVVNEKFNKVMD